MIDRAHAHRMFARIAKDAGLRGEIRRGLRSGPATVLVGPLGALLPPQLTPYDERDWLDATALVVRFAAETSGDRRSLAAAAGAAARATGTRGEPNPGVLRRFTAVIAADREDLPARLPALLSMIGDAAETIDYVAVAADLGRWSFDDRGVQRRWAREFRAAAGMGLTDPESETNPDQAAADGSPSAPTK